MTVDTIHPIPGYLEISTTRFASGKLRVSVDRPHIVRITSAIGIVSCHPGNADPLLASITCSAIELYCIRSGNKDEDRAEGIS